VAGAETGFGALELERRRDGDKFDIFDIFAKPYTCLVTFTLTNIKLRV